MKRTLFLLSAVAWLSGCSTTATLQVVSNPAGAYITEKNSGTALGIAPTEAHYAPQALTKHKEKNGCYLVNGFNAKWISGSESSSEERIRLCGSATGNYKIVINRNHSDPGLDKDLQFGMQIESTIAQQRQTDAAEFAAAAALANSFKPPAAPTSTECLSRRGISGTSVNTTCY